MIPNFLRVIFAACLLGSAAVFYATGMWGWGVLLTILALLSGVTFFFHEYMLLSQWYMRKENFDKAAHWLNKITRYERQLHRKQH